MSSRATSHQTTLAVSTVGQSPQSNCMLPHDAHPFDATICPPISLNSLTDTPLYSPALSIPSSPMIDHSCSGSPAPSLTPSDSISTRGSHPSSFHV